MRDSVKNLLLISLEAYLINAECYFSLSLDFLWFLEFSLSSFRYAQKKCSMQNRGITLNFF